ncbi:MAG: hypothetical protein GX467_06465, partial [Rikenellaceae bacterium]|nr:hypothetical protein [Rikenellaceae bacterium]
MKKIVTPLLISALVLCSSGCGQFNFPVDFPSTSSDGGLTTAEVVKGLK